MLHFDGDVIFRGAENNRRVLRLSEALESIHEHVLKARLDPDPSFMDVKFYDKGERIVMKVFAVSNGEISTLMVTSEELNPFAPHLTGTFHASDGDLEGDVIVSDDVQDVETPRSIVIPTEDILARVNTWIAGSVDLSKWRTKI